MQWVLCNGKFLPSVLDWQMPAYASLETAICTASKWCGYTFYLWVQFQNHSQKGTNILITRFALTTCRVETHINQVILAGEDTLFSAEYRPIQNKNIVSCTTGNNSLTDEEFVDKYGFTRELLALTFLCFKYVNSKCETVTSWFSCDFFFSFGQSHFNYWTHYPLI